MFAAYRHSPFLAALNLVSLVAYGLLLWYTKGLVEGRARYHWLAVGEVVVAAANALVVALEVAILVINIVLWIVIICLCIAIGLALFMFFIALLGWTM